MKPDHYDPIAAALKEDIGQGDVTTDFFVPATLHATGRIIARERAVVAGTGAAAEVFRQVDPSIDTQILRPDGDEVVGGDVMIEVRGLARSILKAERVALNFLQRLCGIATLTRQFVETNLWTLLKITRPKFWIHEKPLPVCGAWKKPPCLPVVGRITVLVYTIWCS
jgi:nicotinate-nucleotide pyrophosphorylase (carboxylating)